MVFPDTRHPNAGLATQRSSKKTHKMELEKALLKNERNLPVYLMFQDEAGIGWLSDPGRC
jgi:hypothetical protein